MAKARYTTEDGTGVYTTEDGAGNYVTETPQVGAAASLGAKTNFTVLDKVYVPGETRHGARARMRAFEVAQLAIGAVYPAGVPEHVNEAEVTRLATKWLKDHPEHHAAVVTKLSRGKIEFSRRTIGRALKTFVRL
jgi:hypothetical protein